VSKEILEDFSSEKLEDFLREKLEDFLEKFKGFFPARAGTKIIKKTNNN